MVATGIMCVCTLQMEDVSLDEELFEPSDKVCNPFSTIRYFDINHIMCASFYIMFTHLHSPMEINVVHEFQLACIVYKVYIRYMCLCSHLRARNSYQASEALLVLTSTVP